MKCNNCSATQATPLLSCPDTAVCGTPFDARCLNWNRSELTALYADKIFSAHRAEGSSIFYQLDTALTPDNFLSVYELTPCAGGCCCSTRVLSEDAVFEIQKTFVQLDCFSVITDGETPPITPANVTVNGLAVCDIEETNGRFTADISCILGELTNPVCLAQNLPSKAFILLQDIGNLQFRIRLGFEGVVRSCGVLYRFKAYLANNTTIPLPADLTTSFAIAEVNIPCVENGSAPVITFRFDGTAELINPRLTVTATDDTDPCGGARIDVTATLGITPRVSVEVIRNTLLLVSAAEMKDCSECGMNGFDLFAGGCCCAEAPEEPCAPIPEPEPDPVPAPKPKPPVCPGRDCGCADSCNGCYGRTRGNR